MHFISIFIVHFNQKIWSYVIVECETEFSIDFNSTQLKNSLRIGNLSLRNQNFTWFKACWFGLFVQNNNIFKKNVF